MALCHGTGSRTNQQIIVYGKALALLYDYIVLADFDPRKRPAGETSELVKQGLLQGGFAEDQIKIVPKSEALDYLFAKVQKGDLLVINPDTLEPIMGQITERFRQMLADVDAQ